MLHDYSTLPQARRHRRQVSYGIFGQPNQGTCHTLDRLVTGSERNAGRGHHLSSPSSLHAASVLLLPTVNPQLQQLFHEIYAKQIQNQPTYLEIKIGQLINYFAWLSGPELPKLFSAKISCKDRFHNFLKLFANNALLVAAIRYCFLFMPWMLKGANIMQRTIPLFVNITQVAPTEPILPINASTGVICQLESAGEFDLEKINLMDYSVIGIALLLKNGIDVASFLTLEPALEKLRHLSDFVSLLRECSTKTVLETLANEISTHDTDLADYIHEQDSATKFVLASTAQLLCGDEHRPLFLTALWQFIQSQAKKAKANLMVSAADFIFSKIVIAAMATFTFFALACIRAFFESSLSRNTADSWHSPKDFSTLDLLGLIPSLVIFFIKFSCLETYGQRLANESNILTANIIEDYEALCRHLHEMTHHAPSQYGEPQHEQVGSVVGSAPHSPLTFTETLTSLRSAGNQAETDIAEHGLIIPEVGRLPGI